MILKEERVLEVYNSTGQIIITIDIPLPISPKDLAIGSDERMLGIWLREINVVPF